MGATEDDHVNHERRIKALEDMVPQMVPLAALNIFARDPHMFSNRPCQTCSTISDVIGRPWGCVTRGAK